MDYTQEPGTPVMEASDVFDEVQVADAVALFNRALEMSEHDWEAAEELFEKSFDGMLELAREGDKTAQYNVALMYGLGINEPYDDNYQEDTDLLMQWVRENEEDLQEYLEGLDDRIEELEKRLQTDKEVSSDPLHDPEGNVDTDHDKETKKLRRLYLLKAKLEKQGFRTGANRDYNDEYEHGD